MVWLKDGNFLFRFEVIVAKTCRSRASAAMPHAWHHEEPVECMNIRGIRVPRIGMVESEKTE